MTQGDYQASLTWTAVSGAAKYWVFRTEGHGGCNLGRALINETTATAYIDTEIADGRLYFYSVMAVGGSSACFGLSSQCKKPDVLASSDYGTLYGVIAAGSYLDTRTSNDVREALTETQTCSPSGCFNPQLLEHIWTFDNVPSGAQQPTLTIEGYRPAGSNDDFLFQFSTNGWEFTSIPGAVINQAVEGVAQTHPFGTAGLSGTIYIRVRDTNVTHDTVPDTVYVDHLAIRAQE